MLFRLLRWKAANTKERFITSSIQNLLNDPAALTHGTVTVDGKEVTALNAQELRQTRRKIGMIFLHFNLMPSRTVAGNVAYPLRGSGLSKKEAADKVTHLLELVGIGDKATAYPSQLSGGQKQRVAIARALANDPKSWERNVRNMDLP